MQVSTGAFDRAFNIVQRIQARRAAAKQIVTALTLQPEPKSLGSVARGRQLTAGNFQFSGHLIEAPHHSPWSLTMPSAAFRDAVHSGVWIDDLLALPEQSARKLAQDWIFDWIDTHGNGKGDGWTPHITGQRVLRWVHNALALMRGQSEDRSDAFLVSLAQQTVFLSKSWHRAAAGKPRFDALCGLLTGALSLEGLDISVDAILAALSKECSNTFAKDGGIASRNPEELLELCALLMWCRTALVHADKSIPAELDQTLDRGAEALRVLQHADGTLTRAHGGDYGTHGRLEQVLSLVKPSRAVNGQSVMGFMRLNVGRSSVIMDAAKPSAYSRSDKAHASTLSFELSSGRRPVIVSAGSGYSFGPDWHLSSRQSQAHSTLMIGGESSSTLLGTLSGQAVYLTTDMSAPKAHISHETSDTHMTAQHDGYAERYGLTHRRSLSLSHDGRRVTGEDHIFAEDRRRAHLFHRALDRNGLSGLPIELRFHLHPSSEAHRNMGDNAVAITLANGEVWALRFGQKLSVEITPSVYFQAGRIAPQESRVIVATAAATTDEMTLRWTLDRLTEGGKTTRDIKTDAGQMSFLRSN